MKVLEKQISYTTTNTFYCLNNLTENTSNVWLVLHGIGYLSRFFLKYFESLPPEENYVIAPQAPSKYYLGGQYKHVGASWLTRENTQMEVENVLTYLDAVYESADFPGNCNVIILGFSQGVSITARWVASRKIHCDQLVFYAGGIPKELQASDFDFMDNSSCQVKVIVGDEDEYIHKERLKSESERIEKLFKGRASFIFFNGGHEMKKDIIHQLIKSDSYATGK